jgi:hypothetical protein
MTPSTLHKYPRTHHLAGSRLQPGDEDLTSTPLPDLAGRHLVVEEKVDGANAAISFDATGRMWLQSRGHFLIGGPRERHFAPLKAWAPRVAADLWATLGDRYVLYGEWLYAKHTIFYDALPHHFLEFDVLDTRTGAFLDTPSRRRLLAGTTVHSVPVLSLGPVRRPEKLPELVGPSTYKTPGWRDALVHTAERRGLDAALVAAQTDPSDEMEGLYVKVEEGGRVVARYKWIRPSFLTSVLDSDSHWLDRPIVANLIGGGP